MATIRIDGEGRKWLNGVEESDIAGMCGQSEATVVWEAYKLYKAAQAEAAKARDAFEDTARVALDNDRLVFGYNFGKLSFRVGGEPAKAKGTAKPSASLADFLDGEDTGGYSR